MAAGALTITRPRVRLDALFVRGLQVFPRYLQIVVGLEVHPEFRAVTEIEAEPKRSVGSNAPPIVDDLGYPIGRNADRLRKLILREPVLREKLLLQHIARR